MPTWQKVSYIISFIVLIVLFIYLGGKNYDVKPKTLPDNELFTKEFGISNNNLFVYKTNEEVLETLNSGSGLIFMAFPENEWSSFYADMLNDVAKELNVKEIYFYNFLKDRKNNNYCYENIVDHLSKYISILDDDTTNLYSPTFVIVKNGEVTYFDSETSILDGEQTINEYWTNLKVQNKKNILKAKISAFL